MREVEEAEEEGADDRRSPPSWRVMRDVDAEAVDVTSIQYIAFVFLSSGAENTVSEKAHVTSLVHGVMRNSQYRRLGNSNSASRHGSSPATRRQKRRPKSTTTLGRRETAKASSAPKQLQQQHRTATAAADGGVSWPFDPIRTFPSPPPFLHPSSLQERIRQGWYLRHSPEQTRIDHRVVVAVAAAAETRIGIGVRGRNRHTE
ncbi:hypothetical protein PHSY_000980 [Pseudozyma hubeiensis SY62]|uniref:Uncharacterized protein n=1 Tax=Pseudozyma hubeiensis (strain SY62) TaxID=1305764 RepID=R9P5Q0_PSEHS|nr:hypothetical protein PHSY_000980 [Pseudozyma hubeiensis SY62]GAC93415.1 hypothetical protein PHSY_000980 [Pseudozyma hubeiensis SY62]